MFILHKGSCCIQRALLNLDEQANHAALCFLPIAFFTITKLHTYIWALPQGIGSIYSKLWDLSRARMEAEGFRMHLSSSVHEGHASAALPLQVHPSTSHITPWPTHSWLTRVWWPAQIQISLCCFAELVFFACAAWYFMHQALLHCRSLPCTRIVLESLPNSLPLGRNKCITRHLSKAEESDYLFIFPQDPVPSVILL